jgi:DNA-directed RNA polymerase subunit RPC12/RpoP
MLLRSSEAAVPFPLPYQIYGILSVDFGGMMAEPIMCPYCGGTNLFQEDDYGLELDYEYWTIHHWDCLDCSQSFDKIEILPASSAFEEINESTIH